MTRQLSTLILGMLLSGPALGAKLSDDCLRTKVWDSYGDGWQVRASTSTEITSGRTYYYRVSMLKGRTYQVVTCADENVANLDVLLYDNEGKVVLRDATDDREPTVSFDPTRTGVHYVVLYVRGAEDPSKPNEVAVALIHK